MPTFGDSAMATPGGKQGWLPRAQLVSNLGARTPHVLTWVGEGAEVHRTAFPRLRVGATCG